MKLDTRGLDVTPYSVVRDYLKKGMQAQLDRIQAQREKYQVAHNEIKQTYKKINEIRHQATDFFNVVEKTDDAQVCPECKQKLELPTVHFMCKHTFHELCIEPLSDIRQCPICSIELERLKWKQECKRELKNDPEAFH